MGGIQTGTRLEKLLALRDRIDHEIAVERARSLDAPNPRDRHVFEKPVRASETVEPSSREVRAWARANGIATTKVGRVSPVLMDAYRLAHTGATA